MEISQSCLLTLTLALGYEYGLKQWWWGSIGVIITKPAYNYVLYRLVHLILLSVSGIVLFIDIRPVDWLIISICFVILGSLELVERLISLKVQKSHRVFLLSIKIPSSPCPCLIRSLSRPFT